MSTQGQQISAAFTALLTQVVPESTVIVVCDGQTVQAMKCVSNSGESFTDQGERGITVERFRIAASTLRQPAKGSTIIVDGNVAIIGDTSIDMLGAILTVNYQLTTEVTIE